MAAPSSSADVEAYRLMRAGQFAEALPFAQQAVAGQRTCLPAHALLATILLRLERPLDAEAVIAQALELAPGVADAYDSLAYVCRSLGQHPRANVLYRRAVELAPGIARFRYNLACSERSFGRLEEAEAACDQAIALDPAQHPTYLLRSELRVQSAGANHIEELKSLLARPGLEDRARVFLGYALAKELDDVRQYDEAFRWFSTAATARRHHLAYDVSVDEQKLGRIAQAFPRASRKAASAVDSAACIFIIGLPRSGTTLLEHILTGLPAVRSNGETDNFLRALMAAAPPGQGDVFARAAAADPDAVAARYISLANVAAAEHVIEKLPMNYLYAGAIHRALPESKILLLRRSPLDSCFAMYRTLFGEAYPFSYSFEDLARYYAAYERLIGHWRAALGGQLQEIVYEDLVSDPLRIGSGIAQRCGLKWSDSAVEVHKSTAVSLTASASQVRRPIYGSSSGRWRHYREHLEPLIAALRRSGVALPDDA